MKQFTACLGLVFRDSSHGTGHKQLNLNSMREKKHTEEQQLNESILNQGAIGESGASGEFSRLIVFCACRRVSKQRVPICAPAGVSVHSSACNDGTSAAQVE